MSDSPERVQKVPSLLALGETHQSPLSMPLKTAECSLFSARSPIKQHEGNEDCAAILSISDSCEFKRYTTDHRR